MESIPRYIAVRGGEKPDYLIPELEPILAPTCGCIVYQEQVMQICRAVAGYSFGRADIVRRAMSKKKHEVMERERGDFVDGAASRGISREKASALFDELTRFASYAFNKSHAAAYSLTSYRTAYLKAHYRAEYMAALLTSVRNNTDKLSEYDRVPQGGNFNSASVGIGRRCSLPRDGRRNTLCSVCGQEYRRGLCRADNRGASKSTVFIRL